MAYTTSFIKKTVWGDQRVFQIKVTADAASGTVATGLSNINGFSIGPVTCTTTGFRSRENALADGTASLGTVGFSGAASGDVFYLTVYGT